MRPNYLPREFSHVIVIAAYDPPSANAEAACDVIHSVTSRLLTQHPTALLLSGDFNHAPPSSTLPTFNQYVTPETIRHWISCMPTPRRHIHHHLSLPWADLTTTWCTSCLCTPPLHRSSQLWPAQLNDGPRQRFPNSRKPRPNLKS